CRQRRGDVDQTTRHGAPRFLGRLSTLNAGGLASVGKPSSGRPEPITVAPVTGPQSLARIGSSMDPIPWLKCVAQNPWPLVGASPGIFLGIGIFPEISRGISPVDGNAQCRQDRRVSEFVR